MASVQTGDLKTFTKDVWPIRTRDELRQRFERWVDVTAEPGDVD